MKDIHELISENKYNFTTNDKIIAKCIRNNPNFIAENDISTAAKKIFVSRTALTRFCHKLGLPGYKELKFMLLMEKKETLVSNPLEYNSLIDIFSNDYFTIIEKLKYNVNEDMIKTSALKISKAKRVFVIGIGSSGFLAQEFSWRLRRLGIFADSICENDFILIQAKIAQKGDFFIYLSQTSSRKILFETVSILNNQKIEILLLTENEQSKLINMCDYVVVTPQKSNLGLSTSISNQFGLLVITDILIHYIILSNHQKYTSTYEMTVLDDESK